MEHLNELFFSHNNVFRVERAVIIVSCLLIAGGYFYNDYYYGCGMETEVIDPYLYDNTGFPSMLQNDFKIKGDDLYSCGAVYIAPQGKSSEGRSVYTLTPCRLLMFDSHEWSIQNGYKRAGRQCELMNMTSVDSDGSVKTVMTKETFESFFQFPKYTTLEYCDSYHSQNNGGQTTLFMLSCPNAWEAFMSVLELFANLVPFVLIVCLMIKTIVEWRRRNGYDPIPDVEHGREVEMTG